MAMNFVDKKGDKKKLFNKGGKGPGDEAKAKAVKSEILTALKGGASDSEIRKMVKASGLQNTYEYNWDNVQMQVEMHKIEVPKAESASKKMMKTLKRKK